MSIPAPPRRYELGSTSAARCESCGTRARWRLADRSTWCDACDEAARRLGYDTEEAPRRRRLLVELRRWWAEHRRARQLDERHQAPPWRWR